MAVFLSTKCSFATAPLRPIVIRRSVFILKKSTYGSGVAECNQTLRYMSPPATGVGRPYSTENAAENYVCIHPWDVRYIIYRNNSHVGIVQPLPVLRSEIITSTPDFRRALRWRYAGRAPSTFSFLNGGFPQPKIIVEVLIILFQKVFFSSCLLGPWDYLSGRSWILAEVNFRVRYGTP